MGITGLLPALKSIHRTRNLSEFKGQTIAVDAYVWLHKGVYSCATDLATGKPTHRYVDYCMHRVRLLLHFGIEPYIVFDGGALPAKRGTEKERKKRREDNRIRGNALVAQGKHSQARECFVKCIDVTPQMAYQFIKALRAENVRYVVAPYEADAQMAFLERIGQVDAILTEDSDLLVFGCQNVLFKLDAVANRVCHISRADFGSVTTSASDTSSINLIGWNDTQFRAMAILSGCDYLPSINGIGLKTANTLLRKWKTAEAAVRTIMMEGKKSVPNGYLNQFKLADLCFRFQRVYDPREGKLVHLTEIDEEWNEEKDIYVGEDMEPEVVRKIASGDIDPTTREEMRDINPSFKPRSLKKLETTPKSPSHKSKGKGKASVGGILAFFGANPLIPREKPAATKITVTNTTRTSSGKKTLGEIMDLDIANQKQRSLTNPRQIIESKFFNQSVVPQMSIFTKQREETRAGLSRINEENKENVYIIIDDDDEEREEILSDLSLKLNVSPSRESDFDLEEPQDVVEQEDGYMSPFSVFAEETQELSSPVAARIFTPTKKKKRRSSARHDGFGSGTDCEEDYDFRGFGIKKPRQDDFDVDPVSSPISTIKRRRRSSSPRPRRLHLTTPTRSISMGNVLVAETPMRENNADELNIGADEELRLFGMHRKITPLVYKGPDLQSCLGDMDDREDVTYDDERESIVNLESYMAPKPLLSDFSNFIKSRMGGVEASSSFESGMISGSGSISPLSSSPHTPADAVKQASVVIGSVKDGRTIIDVDALVEGEEEIEMEVEELIRGDPEETAAKLQKESVKAVAKGWRMKWALGQLNREDSTSSLSSTPSPGVVKKGKQKKKIDSDGAGAKKRRQSAPNSFGVPKLRRSETNVTPLGKHSLIPNVNRQPLQQSQSRQILDCSSAEMNVQRTGELSNSMSSDNINAFGKSESLKKRSSLVFFEEVRPSCANKTKGKAKKPPETIVIDDDDGLSDVDVNERAKLRLAQFRCQ